MITTSSDETPRIACVIDSDIAIDYLRTLSYADRLLEDFARRGVVVVSAITHLEVYRGMRPGEKERTEKFLGGLLSLNVDAELAKQAGTLLNGLRRRGITIDAADAIIAATAMQLDVPLVTNNVSHYPFPALKLIHGRDWKGEFHIKERRRRYDTGTKQSAISSQPRGRGKGHN